MSSTNLHWRRLPGSFVLSLLLAMPAGVVAQPPSEDSAKTESAPPADDAVKEAAVLHREGKARFETLDYEGAIELWTQAYAKLPPTEENREIRNELAYNIATAQEKAYEVDGDVTHLRRAKGLLKHYLEEFKHINKPTEAARAEAKEVEQRIASLEQAIKDAEAGGAAVSPQQAAKQQARSDEARARQIIESDPVLRKKYRSGRGMIIAGSITLGLGLLAVGALGSVDVDAQPDQALGLTVVGGALFITGAVLLPIGIVRFTRAKREARARVVLAPSFDRQSAGMRLLLRF
jgi:hypothetical protein